MQQAYDLMIRFVNGREKTVSLNTPHQLVPDNVRPSALVYTHPETKDIHNIPFSSIEEFSFSPDAYNACAKATPPMSGTINMPTQGCECESCKANAIRIKELAKTL